PSSSSRMEVSQAGGEDSAALAPALAFGKDDTVPPRILRLVKRLVRCFHQAFHPGFGGASLPARDPGAQGLAPLVLPLADQDPSLQFLSDLVHSLARVGGAQGGKKDDEFLPAPAADKVLLPDRRGQNAGRFGQDPVPLSV